MTGRPKASLSTLQPVTKLQPTSSSRKRQAGEPRITEAAERTIARHETLVLIEEERSAFFDILVSPPPVNDRLQRAFKAERRRVAS